MHKYTINDVEQMLKVLDNSQPGNIPLDFTNEY